MGTKTQRGERRLYTVLWVWVALKTLLPWLVFFRLTFEGPSYSWGTSYFGHVFHSSGLARADVLVVYGLLAAGLLVLWALRERRYALAGPLLAGYLGFFAADAVFELVSGEPVMFRGDTLDVTLDISTPFYALQFGMFALACVWWWCVRWRAAGTGAAMTPMQKKTALICAAAVPLQLGLLVSGQPHGTTDEIGVVLTLLQWLLLAAALYPRSPSEVHSTAVRTQARADRGRDYGADSTARSRNARTSAAVRVGASSMGTWPRSS
ncbi:MAG: hypothetical protein RIC56_17330 [Pseudomonadales bacterium]